MERDKPWFTERLPLVEEPIRVRLGALSEKLDSADWLDGAFSAGDLLMVQALRRLSGSQLLSEHPRLIAYVSRAEARPAFKRAFAAQLAAFRRDHSDSDV